MDDQYDNRLASVPKRRGPPSKLETTTPLPESITEFVDLPAPVRGIARPPCCGVGMHPRRTGAAGNTTYATCGHCGKPLALTPLDGDRVRVRVVR